MKVVILILGSLLFLFALIAYLNYKPAPERAASAYIESQSTRDWNKTCQAFDAETKKNLVNTLGGKLRNPTCQEALSGSSKETQKSFAAVVFDLEITGSVEEGDSARVFVLRSLGDDRYRGYIWLEKADGDWKVSYGKSLFPDSSGFKGSRLSQGKKR